MVRFVEVISYFHAYFYFFASNIFEHLKYLANIIALSHISKTIKIPKE